MPACAARSSSDPLESTSAAPTAAPSRRTYSRSAVATWSLRLRPVCSLAPASPASSVTRRSIAVWMSSSVGRKHERAVGQLRARRCRAPRGSPRSRRRRSASRRRACARARASPRGRRARAAVEREAGGEREQLVGRTVAEAPVPQRLWLGRRRVVGLLAHSRPPWRRATVSTDRPHRRTKPAASSWRNVSAAS